MIFTEERDKQAIKSGTVFKGLSVPDIGYYQTEFCKPSYHLLSGGHDGEHVGYAVYEIIGSEVLFHLINFKPVPGGVIGPLYDKIRSCGYSAISASVERPAMARQLKKFGFKNVFGGLYRAEVSHVL